MLNFRLADHHGYVINQITSKATGAHFNLPGHSLADMSITVIEQTKNNNKQYRKERESIFLENLTHTIKE